MTYLTKLTTVLMITLGLLFSSCSGLTDANLDEADETQRVTIETNDDGDSGDAGTDNDADRPQTWHPEPDEYSDDDDDDE